MKIEFFVAGEPQPFPKKQINRRTGMLYSRDPHGHKKGWMDAIRLTARTVMKERGLAPITDCGVSVYYCFYLTRPKAAKKREVPHVKPDLDNLAYAVTNSMTGVVYGDDAQVVDQKIVKLYADTTALPNDPGVWVTVCWPGE